MVDSTEGPKQDDCVTLQHEFLLAFREHMRDSARLDNLDSRIIELKKEQDEFRGDFMSLMNNVKVEQDSSKKKLDEFIENLQPVHDAYLKGMTLKSKMGNIAIGYLVVVALFPQLSPSSLINVIKLLL